MRKPDFYLSSTEHVDFEIPRACWKLRQVKAFNREDSLLVSIVPTIIGQSYGLGATDIDKLIIAPRFANTSLFPISEWPLYVYVCGLTSDEEKDAYETNEYVYLAWAELYPNVSRAKNKK